MNLKALAVSLLSLLLSWNICSAQALRGKVTDGDTGEPLYGANIIEKGTTNGAIADFDGEFSLKLEKLPAALIVRMIGYSEIELTVNSLSERLDVQLFENTVTGPTIVISDTRITEKQKQAPLTVENMDLIAIKQAPSGNFYEGLGALKGVDLTTASLGFRIINTRGFNSTSPVRTLQLIDGVDNQSPGLNFSLGNFLGAPDLDVKGVDIIQGASSAFYGPGAFNGVISMETKNPFLFTGFSAQLRVGERNLVEPVVRWAEKWKNKKGYEFIAVKFNVYAMRALDWEADNYDPVYEARHGAANPGRFDAVNIYGDEFFNGNNFEFRPWTYKGLGTFYRTGYKERDVVDYNTENLKANAAVHLRVKPELGINSPELIYAANYGRGSTVFQGDNRFRLENIQFYQNRLELRKKDKYFIRFYATNEDAGDSYDPYFTSLRILEEARSDADWAKVYERYWDQLIEPTINQSNYPGLVQNPNWPGPVVDPDFSEFFLPYDYEALETWQNNNASNLVQWHALVEDSTNNGNAGIVGIDPDGYFEPGSPEFEEAFNRITRLKNNEGEGGTRFFDRSALYHAHAEYQWEDKFFIQYKAGMNGRLYRPFTDGTIFSDSTSRISNSEFGAYLGLSRKFLEDKLVVTATGRVDKNQNFDAIFSPAASAVYQLKKDHYIRASFSSALRNPTLADQFLYLNVGPAILSGNLNGVDSLITLSSFGAYLNSLQTDSLEYFNIDPIRPEQVRSVELGYRAIFSDKLFVDASAYHSVYTNFIGFNIGVDASFDTETNLINDVQVFRYSANSKNTVTTQGLSVGVNYYVYKGHAINANYSYNKLVRADENDPIIPAFNTPEHKYNVGISGLDWLTDKKGNSFGYSINYKWIEGFLFEGSPQFTGIVPTYTLLDAQLNYDWKVRNMNFKLGASNLLNNLQFQTYGGPRIGRMIYFTWLYEFSK